MVKSAARSELAHGLHALVSNHRDKMQRRHKDQIREVLSNGLFTKVYGRGLFTLDREMFRVLVTRAGKGG